MCKTYTVCMINDRPTIKLTGKWLINNGFHIGDKVRLYGDDEVLILVKADKEEIIQEQKQRKILSLEKKINHLKRN